MVGSSKVVAHYAADLPTVGIHVGNITPPRRAAGRAPAGVFRASVMFILDNVCFNDPESTFRHRYHMYLAHYGLNQMPFGITPNPAFFYSGNQRGAIR